ncbi:unnamed protein product [Cylicostephanus goldi]|uniref:Uncharacterized protein n=1 Tax=Cylicostephanus goldi TaxID=71465 RepID=A0A3P6SB48_CYLGO|nr:unnamed protein product [Cylicostephanus goldi]
MFGLLGTPYTQQFETTISRVTESNKTICADAAKKKGAKKARPKYSGKKKKNVKKGRPQVRPRPPPPPPPKKPTPPMEPAPKCDPEQKVMNKLLQEYLQKDIQDVRGRHHAYPPLVMGDFGVLPFGCKWEMNRKEVTCLFVTAGFVQYLAELAIPGNPALKDISKGLYLLQNM